MVVKTRKMAIRQAVLESISRGFSHNYTIANSFVPRLSQGSVDQALHTLQKDGYIQKKDYKNERKIPYILTSKGELAIEIRQSLPKTLGMPINELWRKHPEARIEEMVKDGILRKRRIPVIETFIWMFPVVKCSRCQKQIMVRQLDKNSVECRCGQENRL